MKEQPYDIAELMNRAAQDDEDALLELEELADEDPSVLTPFLERLVGSEAPPELFAGADDAVQRLLVAEVDTGEYIDGPLCALAQARGPVARDAFRRWRREPPPGMSRLYYTVDQYTRTGDWELTPDGGVRELHGTAVFDLLWHIAAQVPCALCDRPLDVLLDIDTRREPGAAEAMAHTGWSGRLRLALCERCDFSREPLYLRVTPEGASARVSQEELRHTTGQLPSAQGGMPVPEPRVTLGDRRAVMRSRTSALGGRPAWLLHVDPAYPACPVCGATMDYIAQFDSGDSLADWYNTLFLHAPCGVAARVEQG